MSTKHTQGPWMWEGNTLRPVEPNPQAGAVSSILYAEGGYGFLGSKTADTLAELEADRELIAAAPDLLAALQVVVENWTSQFERAGHMAPAWCKQARAAITHATGGVA